MIQPRFDDKFRSKFYDHLETTKKRNNVDRRSPKDPYEPYVGLLQRELEKKPESGRDNKGSEKMNDVIPSRIGKEPDVLKFNDYHAQLKLTYYNFN